VSLFLATRGEANTIILATPTLAAVLSIMPFPPSIRPAMLWIAALTSMGVVVIGAASIGMLFLPSAFALFAVASPGGRGS
jgi:hypothetical protein